MEVSLGFRVSNNDGSLLGAPDGRIIPFGVPPYFCKKILDL